MDSINKTITNTAWFNTTILYFVWHQYILRK